MNVVIIGKVKHSQIFGKEVWNAIFGQVCVFKILEIFDEIRNSSSWLGNWKYNKLRERQKFYHPDKVVAKMKQFWLQICLKWYQEL